VKPANILVGPDDRAYLSDFGVVKELTAAGTTRTGSFIGTIEYCAPEQIEGKDVDARAECTRSRACSRVRLSGRRRFTAHPTWQC